MLQMVILLLQFCNSDKQLNHLMAAFFFQNLKTPKSPGLISNLHITS